MAQPLQVFQNQLEPVASYVVAVKGSPYPLTGCTVAFSMRPVGSAVLTVDHKAGLIIGDPLLGQVEYDWSGSDTATVGDYVGWFTITLANGKPQDTPEFEVQVLSHSTASSAAIVSLEEVVDHLRLANMLKNVSANDQQQLRSLIIAASQVCEEYTNHRFLVETATAKSFTYMGEVILDLTPFDLQSISLIQIDTDTTAYTLDPTQYRLEPRNKPYSIYTHVALEPFNPGGTYGRSINFWGGGGTFGHDLAVFGRQVTITGAWGWPTIPEPLKYGVKVLVGRWFQNPLAAENVRNGNLDIQYTRGSGGPEAVFGDDLPEEVRTAWRAFRRPGTG